MGMLDNLKRKGKKVKSSLLHSAAKVDILHTPRRAAKNAGRKYAPLFGSSKTLAGTRLSPKQSRKVEQARSKDRRHTKKVLRRIWRKLV